MEKTGFVQITRQKKIAEKEFYPVINAMYEQIWQNLLPPQILTDGLTTRVANNVITPPDALIPDCLTCGACCMALPCVGVRPSEEISAEDYWDITIKGEKGEITVDRYLRRDAETLACTALEIIGGTRAICRIYEQRPRICHDFEAGSDKCHALRRAFGYEPFLSLEGMSESLRKIDKKPVNSVYSEAIQGVKFIEIKPGELQISASMKDGSVRKIHTFNPKNETWRQFEFDGLVLSEAKDLIASRKQNEADLNP